MTTLASRAAAPLIPAGELDVLDRLAIGYLTLPLLVFVAGWLQWWAALPLLGCCLYALRALLGPLPARPTGYPLTGGQVAVAIAIGCSWTALGGTAHLFFPNSDWHIRDAVLHDLVAAPWPVGYGPVDGQPSLLRSSIGYFLPAALLGKLLGVQAAFLALAAWTAAGVTIFLLQVRSLAPARAEAGWVVAIVVVLFSGLDILGNLLNGGWEFHGSRSLVSHLEWWAMKFQYSSMTTQLFWVPNHALGAWLAVGLLCRNEQRSGVDPVLPMVAVAIALWSPLSALGAVPFLAWKAGASAWREQSLRLLHPKVWVPALVVGAVIAAYLTLDSGAITSNLAPLRSDNPWLSPALHVQFFVLEAGLLGAAVLALRPSAQVLLALVILAVLPLYAFGPGNDLVMRGSIPSLVVLVIGTCRALLEPVRAGSYRKQAVVGGLLAVGAVTPAHEIARALLLPTWPVDAEVTLVAAACNTHPPHYVARLAGQPFTRLLRPPSTLPTDPGDTHACANISDWLLFEVDL